MFNWKDLCFCPKLEEFHDCVNRNVVLQLLRATDDPIIRNIILPHIYSVLICCFCRMGNDFVQRSNQRSLAGSDPAHLERPGMQKRLPQPAHLREADVRRIQGRRKRFVPSNFILLLKRPIYELESLGRIPALT